jgi:hypothetical protein
VKAESAEEEKVEVGAAVEVGAVAATSPVRVRVVTVFAQNAATRYRIRLASVV